MIKTMQDWLNILRERSMPEQIRRKGNYSVKTIIIGIGFHLTFS